MPTNAKNLALRDPALAALVGAIHSVNFGNESSAGAADDFGDELGDDFGDDFGDELGDDFGDDFGDEIGAAPQRRRKINPAKARAAISLWNRTQRKQTVTAKREAILEPNRGSTSKIERYAFPLANLTVDPTFGVSSAYSASDQPDVTIRPRRVVSNIPTPALLMLAEVKVSNISVSVGHGAIDAFTWNAGGMGVTLDMPTIQPSQRASITGTWTALVPPGYAPGTTFPVSFTLIGPAKMAG